MAVTTTSARLENTNSSGSKVALNFIVKTRRQQTREAQKARKDTLEGALVRVTTTRGLASSFVHNLGVIHKKDAGTAPNVGGTGEPNGLVGMVVKGRGT